MLVKNVCLSASRRQCSREQGRGRWSGDTARQREFWRTVFLVDHNNALVIALPHGHRLVPARHATMFTDLRVLDDTNSTETTVTVTCESRGPHTTMFTDLRVLDYEQSRNEHDRHGTSYRPQLLQAQRRMGPRRLVIINQSINQSVNHSLTQTTWVRPQTTQQEHSKEVIITY